jgi:hypothetical protein
LHVTQAFFAPKALKLCKTTMQFVLQECTVQLALPLFDVLLATFQPRLVEVRQHHALPVLLESIWTHQLPHHLQLVPIVHTVNIRQQLPQLHLLSAYSVLRENFVSMARRPLIH